MSNYEIFAYVFHLKSSVVVPVDYSQLHEAHYLCLHREPMAEFSDTNPRAVCAHLRQISLGPSWYKRGLKPLAPPDVVWCNGTGYMLIPDPVFSGAFFRTTPAVCHDLDGIYVQEVNLDPEKILACKV